MGTLVFAVLEDNTVWRVKWAQSGIMATYFIGARERNIEREKARKEGGGAESERDTETKRVDAGLATNACPAYGSVCFLLRIW